LRSLKEVKEGWEREVKAGVMAEMAALGGMKSPPFFWFTTLLFPLFPLCYTQSGKGHVTGTLVKVRLFLSFVLYYSKREK